MNPAIGLPEHLRRRERLMAAMGTDAVAIIPSADLRYRSRDVEYPFRQDSDFHYLTGFEEAGGLLVLAPGREESQSILFCQERDERSERYNGERLGPERAAEALGLDEARPSGELAAALPGLLTGTSRVYVEFGAHPAMDERVLKAVAALKGRGVPEEFITLSRLLHEQRLVKAPVERRLMAQAADITTAAHLRAMRQCAPGMTEAQLEAELVHEFMRRGARAAAYPSIVAGGANACVLHYTKNDAELRDGDLVLIDAGCEYQHYAADVTRTFPVNGRFTPPQRDLYEVVLAAQHAAIDAARPEASFDAPHEAAMQVLAQGLIDLGILAGDVDEVLEEKTHEPFTIHRTSHWLGMDVHDVGAYEIEGTSRPLKAGMALTIEPGLYFPDDPESEVPPPWRGMGIRIEDDVLIGGTGDGAEDVQTILSAAVPKAINDIEALMRG